MDLTTVIGTLANFTNDGIIITDAPEDIGDVRILYVNPALERLCGYTLDELKGQNPRMLQGRERGTEAASRIRKALDDRGRVRERIRNYTKYGRPYWIEVDIAPVKEDGRTVYFVAVERDVTKEVEREERMRDLLRDNQAALDIQTNMLNILPAEVVLLDERGIIRMANNAWTEFGAENGASDSFVGLNYLDICRRATDDDRHGPLMAEALHDILADRREMVDLIYPCHCESEQRWFSVMARGFDTASGRMVVVMHVNVTARVRAEQRLRAMADRVDRDVGDMDVSCLGRDTQSEDAMGDIAHITHELRTPLNAIIGYSDMIRTQIKGEIDPAYTSYATSINEAGHHLLTLITDVLDASTIGAGKLSLAEQEIALGDLLETVGSMVRPQAEAKDIRLETRPGKPLVLACDPVRMKQALLNFVSNAVKFTPAGGTVRLGGAVEGDALTITVSDNGIGMAQADARKLFTPYHRARNARHVEGTGLGMVIAKGIIGAHDGDIDVSSVEGAGTSVHVHLPLSRVRTITEPVRLKA